MRPLSLHHTTVIDVAPLDLVPLAAQAGCQGVCLFIHSPNPALHFPLVAPAMVPELRAMLRDTGLAVTNVEYVYIAEDSDIPALEPVLALGAELGAERLVVHVHDPVFARATDRFGTLCEAAAAHSLDACIEFYGLARGCNDLPSAVRLLEAANQPNSGVAIDCLHVIRTGSSPADVAALDVSRLGYGQLCDGPLHSDRDRWMDELKNGRMVPGTGELPLVELVRAVPSDLPIDVEVPRNRPGDHDIPAAERIRTAVEGARHIIAIADRN